MNLTDFFIDGVMEGNKSLPLLVSWPASRKDSEYFYG